MKVGNTKLTLSPLKKQYLEFLRKVRNRPEINKYLFTDSYISKNAQRKWYKQKYSKDKTRLIFIVLINNYSVGYGQITHIDYHNRSCEIGLSIAPEYQGKGYGGEVVKKLLDHASRKLRMHRIYLEAFSDNKRAIKLYEKCGFKKEGILRDKIIKGKKFRDVILMSVIKK